jgi:hypothetical protein
MGLHRPLLAFFIYIGSGLLLFGPASAWLGREKGRRGLTWYVVGLFLGVIGLLVAIGAPVWEQSHPGKPRPAG